MNTPLLPLLPPIKYNNDAATVNNTPRHLVGVKVGTVTLRKVIKNTRSYEFAAWSTDLESVTGTYDVVVGLDSYNYVNSLRFYAQLDAVVTDDNCAPHFGGVAFGPAKKDRVGGKDSFTLVLPPLQSLHENRSRYVHETANYSLDLDLNNPVGREIVETILLQSQQNQAQLESFLNDKLAQRDFRQVAHYARQIAEENSARTSAAYTLSGKNGSEAAVELSTVSN